MNKLSRSLSSLCVVAALSLTACGQSENAEVNTTLVESEIGPAVKSLMSMRSGNGGADAIGPVLALGASGQQMLKASDAEQSRRATLAAQEARKLARMAREQGGDKCACDEDKCDFNGCDLGAFGKIEGKVEWTETSLNCDYKAVFSVEEAGSKFSTSLSTFCDLKFTETTLDGKLSSQGEVEGKSIEGAFSVSWESSFTFEGIKYDTDKGKITQGVAKVEAEVAADGEDTLRGSASIDFSKES